MTMPVRHDNVSRPDIVRHDVLRKPQVLGELVDEFPTYIPWSDPGSRQNRSLWPPCERYRYAVDEVTNVLLTCDGVTQRFVGKRSTRLELRRTVICRTEIVGD